jgi:hypothetical protein
LILSLCFNYAVAGETDNHPIVTDDNKLDPQLDPNMVKGGLSMALNEAFFDNSKNFFLYYLFQQLETPLMSLPKNQYSL